MASHLSGASPWELAALAWLALLGVPLAVIDLRSQRLPDLLTIPAFAGVIALLGAGAIAARQPGRFGLAIGGAAALAGFYLALMVIRPAGMFLGDVKLAASVGAALSWAGWPALLAATFFAFTLAACCALVLIAARRMTRASYLPFGPFLLLGALIAVLIALAAASRGTGRGSRAGCSEPRAGQRPRCRTGPRAWRPPGT